MSGPERDRQGCGDGHVEPFRHSGHAAHLRPDALRPCQLLLGHTKLESTARYLGIGVDDVLSRSEQPEI